MANVTDNGFVKAMVFNKEHVRSPWRWCEIRLNTQENCGKDLSNKYCVHLRGELEEKSNIRKCTEWETSKQRLVRQRNTYCKYYQQQHVSAIRIAIIGKHG